VNLDWRAMLGAVGVLRIGYVFVGYRRKGAMVGEVER